MRRKTIVGSPWQVGSAWQGTYSDLLARLHWPTLSIRRQKAALCYRIINNHSIIPSSLFTPHPSPKLRHHPTIIPKFVLLLIFHHSLSVWYLFGIASLPMSLLLPLTLSKEAWNCCQFCKLLLVSSLFALLVFVQYALLVFSICIACFYSICTVFSFG